LVFSVVLELSGGEFSVLADIWRLETEHDVFVRYAGFKQSVGDRAVGSVVLNPDSVVPKFRRHSVIIAVPLAL